jgi:uncharacterized protein (DUF433 family)
MPVHLPMIVICRPVCIHEGYMTMDLTQAARLKFAGMEPVREIYGGEVYEYYPLSEHIVVAPGVCGGRPTFKYTRLEVSTILSLIAAGETVKQIAQAYALSRLTPDAVREAIYLADQTLVQSTQLLPLAA